MRWTAIRDVFFEYACIGASAVMGKGAVERKFLKKEVEEK